MATEADYRATLIPTESFGPMRIARYKDEGRKKKLFKGEAITWSARTIDDPYYYYIDEGQIVCALSDESGNDVPVMWRNAGNALSAEYDGFASIGRYQAHLVATKNSVLSAFSQRQLYELAQRDPDVFYEFIRMCHANFAQNARRLSNTGIQSSSKRLVMWLQKLCAVHQPNKRRTYAIPCTMTLQQLSQLLFIHISTCTKLIAALEKDGVIRRTRTTIYVYGTARLEAYGLDDHRIAY